MKVELLVSDWCPTCPAAERVWSEVAREREFGFAVLDMAQPEGRALAHAHRIRTIPAVVVDGRLAGVGVQSLKEARGLVAAAPARRKSSPLHAGMTLSRDNRWFVISAMAYLLVSAAWIAGERALVTGGAMRAVGVHLFAAGFVLSLIYGLGAHMLPRFTGNPIQVGVWPWVQMALLHAGLVMFISGAVLESRALSVLGALLMWTSFAVFAQRVWPVLWPHTKPRRTRLRQGPARR